MIDRLRQRSLTEAISYTPVGETRLDITATSTEQSVAYLDEHGSAIVARVRQFIILASDLVGDGEPEDDAPPVIDPKRGDLIESTIEGKVHHFEVLQPAGEDVWAWTSPQQTSRRVFAKLKAVAP